MESKLGPDMMYEILSHSSLETLASSRLLSKEFNLLTYESEFLKLHSQRTPTVSGFFLQSLKRNKFSSTFVSTENLECKNISLAFLPATSVRILASSLQGLLVCVDNTTIIPKYYVCKPLTKEWQLIPNPRIKFFCESIGIKVLNSNPLEYKIVRFSRPKHFIMGKHYCLRCEIYDSMVGRWRQFEDQIRLQYDEPIRPADPVVSVGGRFHRLTSKSVFAFDIDHETYSLFPLPDSSNCYKEFDLTEYAGKLGVIGKGDGFFELWVMENYQEKKWGEGMRVSTESIEKEKNMLFYPAAFCNADVALVLGYYSVFFFKFNKGNRVDEVRLENNVLSDGIYPFRSDFEHCNMN